MTLLSLYFLIFVIFAIKSKMIVENWRELLSITPIAVVFYTIMIAVTLTFNKYIAKLSYEDNQSVVFTSVSKNVALTIGFLASMGREGRVMATYPAIVSLFQIVFLMTYLHFSDVVEKWWKREKEMIGGERI